MDPSPSTCYPNSGAPKISVLGSLAFSPSALSLSRGNHHFYRSFKHRQYINDSKTFISSSNLSSKLQTYLSSCLVDIFTRSLQKHRKHSILKAKRMIPKPLQHMKTCKTHVHTFVRLPEPAPISAALVLVDGPLSSCSDRNLGAIFSSSFPFISHLTRSYGFFL